MLKATFAIFFGLLYINRFTDNVIIKFLPTLLLTFVGYSYLRDNKKQERRLEIRWSVSNIKYLSLLILTLVVGLLRNNNPTVAFTSSVLSAVYLVAFVFLAVQIYKRLIYRDNLVSDFFVAIVFPFVLFAIANLLAYFIGISPVGAETSNETSQAVFLAKLGIIFNRIRFPFASGINSYATLMGGVLCLILCYIFILKKRKTIHLLSLCVVVFTLLLTDSRSCLIYPALICIFIYVAKYKDYKNYIKYIPTLLIVGPVIMVFLLPIFGSIDFISAMSRSDQDFATGNARFTIWLFSINNLLIFKPIQLIGYGLYGHYASGASLQWSNVFSSFGDNSDFVHPHCSALSIIFDYGYLGLFVVLYILFKISNRLYVLWDTDQNSCLLILPFFLYFALISVTESFFGFYYLNTMFLILLVSLFPLMKKQGTKHS